MGEVAPEMTGTHWMPDIMRVSNHVARILPGVDVLRLEREGRVTAIRTETPGRHKVIDPRVLEAELAALGHDVSRLELARLFPAPPENDAGASVWERIRAALPKETPEQRATRLGPNAGKSGPLYSQGHVKSL